MRTGRRVRRRAALTRGVPPPRVYEWNGLPPRARRQPTTDSALLGRTLLVARHQAVPRVARVALRLLLRGTARPAREARDLGLQDRRHARPHDREAVLVARRGRPRVLVRIARKRLLRDEAVAERAARRVDEDARLALPAAAVGRVERVDVHVPAVAVVRVAGRRRRDPV